MEEESPKHKSYVFEKLSEVSELTAGEDVQEKEIRRFLSSFSSLLLFLQYFGLLVGEGFGLGVWGLTFRWLDSLSVIVNLDIEEAILLGITAFIISYPLILVVALKYLIRIKDHDELSFNAFYDQVLLISPLFVILILIISLLVALIVEPSVFPIAFILSAYYMIFWIIYFSIKRVLKKVDAILTLRTFILFLYTPLASLVTSLTFTGNFAGGVVANGFGIFAFFILIYILILEVQFAVIIRNKNKEKKPQRLLKFLCLCTCCVFNKNDQEFIENNLSNEYRSNRWIFSTYFIIERIAIASGETAISDADDDDNEAVRKSILFMCIFFMTMVLILIFRPFKERIDNRIEGVPRLIIFFMSLTILVSQALTDSVLSQFFLFILTLITTIFWVYHLKPITFYKALKARSKENFGTVVETQMKLKWHQVDDLESTRKILTKKKKKMIKQNEWNILSPKQRIMVFVHQSSSLRESDRESIPDPIKNLNSGENVEIGDGNSRDVEDLEFEEVNEAEKIFSLSQFNAAHFDTPLISKALKKFETFDFSSNKFSENFFQFLNEVKIFKIVSNVTILNLNQSINLNIEDLNSLSDALQCSKIVKIDLSKSKLKDDLAAGLAQIIKKSPCLEVFNLRENCIKNQGFSIILDSVTKKSSLKSLLLDMNFIENISADSVHHDSSLTRLTLAYNYFSEESLELAILKLAEIVSLRTLEVAFQNNAKTIEENYKFSLTNRFSGRQSFGSFVQVGNWFRLKNSKIRALEINPELKFDKVDNAVVEASTQTDKLFEFEDGIICSLTPFLWKQLKKGLCCMIITGLRMATDEELQDIGKVLNKRDVKNRTVLELVLVHGISHVKHCIEELVNFGANLTVETRNGDSLTDIARKHEDKELISWLETLH